MKDSVTMLIKFDGLESTWFFYLHYIDAWKVARIKSVFRKV